MPHDAPLANRYRPDNRHAERPSSWLGRRPEGLSDVRMRRRETGRPEHADPKRTRQTPCGLDGAGDRLLLFVLDLGEITGWHTTPIKTGERGLLATLRDAAPSRPADRPQAPGVHLREVLKAGLHHDKTPRLGAAVARRPLRPEQLLEHVPGTGRSASHLASPSGAVRSPRARRPRQNLLKPTSRPGLRARPPWALCPPRSSPGGRWLRPLEPAFLSLDQSWRR